MRVYLTILPIFLAFLINAQSPLTNLTSQTTNLTAADLTAYNSYSAMPDIIQSYLVSITSPTQFLSNNETSITIGSSMMSWKTAKLDYISNNDYLWIGERYSGNQLSTDYVFIGKNDGVTVGQISYGNDLYNIFSLSENQQVLLKVNTNIDLTDTCNATCPDLNVNCSSDGNGSSVDCSDKACTIKLLTMYTAAMAAKYTKAQFINFSQMVVHQANVAMFRSRISHKIHLVGVEPETSYKEGSLGVDFDLFDANNFARSGNNEINSFKQIYTADVISIFIDESFWKPNYFGNSSLPAGNATGLCNLVSLNGALGVRKTFTHEFGHLLNARHEDDNRAPPGRAKELFINGGSLVTMLFTGTKLRILNYSNPEVLYSGVTTGDFDRFNACNMRAHGCIAANLFPNTGYCEYTLSGTTSLDCPTILDFLKVETSPGYPNYCDHPQSVNFEYSWDGINYTSIQNSTNKICYPNIVILDEIFIRVTIVVGNRTVFLFKQFKNQCLTNPNGGGRLSQNHDLTIQYYPNPAAEELFLETNMPFSMLSKITICNQAGQKIMSKEFDLSKKLRLNIKDLAKGVYSISIKNDLIHFNNFFIKE